MRAKALRYAPDSPKPGIKINFLKSRGHSLFGVLRTITGITGLTNCSQVWIAGANLLFSKKLSTGLSWTVTIWVVNRHDSLRASRLEADEIRRAAQPARVNAALWV